jgi:excisionase family DNA binding protein
MLELQRESLHQTSGGNAVTVMPVLQELTTQEAGDLMNVSRPFLITLQEKGELSFHRVGSIGGCALAAVSAFKSKPDEAREKALDLLATRSQETKLG